MEEKGAQLFLGECDLYGNCGMVVILLSFFVCEYDTLTLNLYQVNAATLIKGGFLLADSKLKVSRTHERVLLL